METTATKLYEGMFLVDSADAAADWDGVLGTVKTILDRAGAEVVSVKKWDERKLAYEINRKSRGTYILSYFRVDGSKIAAMERDVRLNERIMRALILNAEHMTQQDIDKATPLEMVERGEVRRDEDEDKSADSHRERYRRPRVEIDVVEVEAEPEETTEAKEDAGGENQ